MQHRIRQLREARKMSQEALGQLIGRTKHQISRIESGATKLDVNTADAIAQALGVGIDEVLGLKSVANGSAGGFRDEAVPYQASPDDPLGRAVSDQRYTYKIDSDALENIGIRRGDDVVVDASAAAVAAVRPLQAVLINWRSASTPGKSVILPRQYVPPALAITNGPRLEPSIALGQNAYIFAVIVSVHRTIG